LFPKEETKNPQKLLLTQHYQCKNKKQTLKGDRSNLSPFLIFITYETTRTNK
jgi:hypothetical protein